MVSYHGLGHRTGIREITSFSSSTTTFIDTRTNNNKVVVIKNLLLLLKPKLELELSEYQKSSIKNSLNILEDIMTRNLIKLSLKIY